MSTKLDWRGDRAKRAMENVKRIGAVAVAAQIEGLAKSFAPVDSGRLRDSFAFREDGDGAIVGTNVEYAPYVEYGTRRTSARPYFRPAIDTVAGRAPEIVARDGRRGFNYD